MKTACQTFGGNSWNNYLWWLLMVSHRTIQILKNQRTLISPALRVSRFPVVRWGFRFFPVIPVDSWTHSGTTASTCQHTGAHGIHRADRGWGAICKLHFFENGNRLFENCGKRSDSFKPRKSQAGAFFDFFGEDNWRFENLTKSFWISYSNVCKSRFESWANSFSDFYVNFAQQHPNISSLLILPSPY